MAYPRILQRLFANNGAGPLLRADILPVQNVAIDNLFIGAPIYQPTTTLPANCMWPDGSLALFIDWPEFAAKYRAGGFAGMVDNSSNSANLGKFILNANGTGLYLPRHGGQFMRNWCPGFGTAGAWGRDEIREITGEFGYVYVVPNSVVATGMFEVSSSQITHLDGTSKDERLRTFRARVSRVVPTGPENVPSHIRQPIAIYMGHHA